MKRNVFGLFLAATAMFISPLQAENPPAPLNPQAPLSKTEIEQVIREYILQHPEVLMESVRAHQERERRAVQQRAKDAIVTKHKELFEDDSSPVAGAADARVPIVQFFDYSCGYCRRVSPTLTKLLEQKNVRVIYKELPILGPPSLMAAKAALAAQKQGAYLEFHRALMNLSAPVTMAAIEEIGGKLKLDVAKLKTDMESPAVQEILTRNHQLANTIGVQSTPSFVIGNELIPGALDLAGFQSRISSATKQGEPQ